MKVLITGVAGFIGSHVAEHCLKLGMSVVGIDDLSGGVIENLPEGAEFHRRDCSSAHEMKYVFEQFGPFDAVYHLAAYAAEGLSHFIRRFNYENNLGATATIINECIRQKAKTGKTPHLVFTSSIAVYGHVDHEKLPVSESMAVSPIDPYGIAKYACELDIKAAAEMWGITYTIFRPYNVYGPKQNLNDPYRNVVGIFMRQAMQGKPFTIFGDGSQSRAFSYIEDVAPSIAGAPCVDAFRNKTFNIGGRLAFTVDQLASVISAAFDIEKRVEWLPKRKEVHQIYACPRALDRAYGIIYEPTHLKDGICLMAAWAKTQTLKTPQPFAAVEVDLNLPESWKALVT